jgi:uncharacterized lipoprotein
MKPCARPCARPVCSESSLMPVSRMLLLLAAVLLPACSALEKERFIYRQSQGIAPLKIPAGLDAPRGENELPLPAVDTARVGVDVTPPVNLPEKSPIPATDSTSDGTD